MKRDCFAWWMLFCGIFISGFALRDWIGCASTLEAKGADVVQIGEADLACLFQNAAEPDAVIVSRCSPAGDVAKSQTIQVYLAICHRPKDAGRAVDGAEGNLWTNGSVRRVSFSREWRARSLSFP